MRIKKQDRIEIIFEFWNSFKGSQTSTDKLNPKTGGIIHWRSHNKLTYDMKFAIEENLKYYSLEDMCTAINNYADALLGSWSFWTHVWPLTTFFTVRYKIKDAGKKWWKFLPETYDSQLYLKNKSNIQREVKDPNPDLTNKLTKSLSKWGLCKKGFEPSAKQINQIRLTVQRMTEFYKDRTCQNEEIWLEDLFDCIEQNYLCKGDAVSIGLLCSDHLWNILIPQLLRSCGGV